MSTEPTITERVAEASKTAFNKLADALEGFERRHGCMCEEAVLSKAFEEQNDPKPGGFLRK